MSSAPTPSLSARSGRTNRLLWGTMLASLVLHGGILISVSNLETGRHSDRFEVELAPPGPRSCQREVPRPTPSPPPQPLQAPEVAIRPIAQVTPAALRPSQFFKAQPAAVTPAKVLPVAGSALSLNKTFRGAPRLKRGLLEDPLKAYLGLIRKRIETNKIYPPLSMRNGEKGEAIVRFVIGRDGTLLSVDLGKSSGYPRLNRAACDAVRRSAPFPRLPGEHRLPLTVSVSIVFHLSREKSTQQAEDSAEAPRAAPV